MEDRNFDIFLFYMKIHGLWRKAVGSVVFLLIFFLAGSVRADVIEIKNGDSISGEIIRLQDGVLTFKTSYAGELTIKWEDIVSLKTDTPVWLKLQDDTILSAAGLMPAEDRSFRIESDETQLPVVIQLSQVDTIHPEAAPPEAIYSGRVNFGAGLSSGNTQNRKTLSDGELAARGQSNRFMLGWLYQHEKSEGERTADNQSATLSHHYFFDRKWYGLANIAGTRDEFKNLKLRTDAGLGAGYQVWESKMRNLAFELGAGIVNEDYDIADNNRYSAGRWAVKFDHTIGRTGIRIFHGHDGLYGVEDTSEILIRSATGFRMPIFSRLTSAVQVKWDWENQPAEGREYSDLNYMLTFGYSF